MISEKEKRNIGIVSTSAVLSVLPVSFAAKILAISGLSTFAVFTSTVFIFLLVTVLYSSSFIILDWILKDD